MPDPSMDFRYIKDGIEVEGYQITEETRYQDKLWPAWLDSRDFITVDGSPWIKIGGEELPIPQYGWLVMWPDGHKGIVPAMEFETYVKVVPLEPDPMLAEAEAAEAPAVQNEIETSELLVDIQTAIEMLHMGASQAENGLPPAAEAALDHLMATIVKRVVWCNCPPDQCDGGDVWSCRTKSPLVSSR